jgi:hypothetical protein
MTGQVSGLSGSELGVFRNKFWAINHRLMAAQFPHLTVTVATLFVATIGANAPAA